MLQGIQSYDCPWGEILNGSFDKFLKISYYLTDFNTKSYHINLSVAHSDSAEKKFSGSTAFARNCPHLRARGAGGPAPFPALP